MRLVEKKASSAAKSAAGGATPTPTRPSESMGQFISSLSSPAPDQVWGKA